MVRYTTTHSEVGTAGPVNSRSKALKLNSGSFVGFESRRRLTMANAATADIGNSNACGGQLSTSFTIEEED